MAVAIPALAAFAGMADQRAGHGADRATDHRALHRIACHRRANRRAA
jgi:hypothetical protein